MWFWAVLFFIAVYSQKSEAQLGKTCVTPSQEIAKCISIYSCNRLSNLVLTEDPEIRQYLKNSFCEWEGNVPLVCCGTRTPPYPDKSETQGSKLLPGKDICGYQNDFNKILGGTETYLEEFPWLALLGYTKNRSEVAFRCSGALISKRYVLTAAHCLTFGTLVSVRLGEWNLNSANDCVGGRFNKQCIQAVDVEVEEVKLHENYRFYTTELSNDIALIRLKREVKFTGHIQPICLPENAEEKSNPGERLWVSGWGMTDLESGLKSNIKQKVQLPVVSMSQCTQKYDMYGGIQITEMQLCAGGQKGKDACIGDSGAPLMATKMDNQLQSYVEGIVSFSIYCGTNMPGVYTRVSAYLDWIKRNIKE